MKKHKKRPGRLLSLALAVMLAAGSSGMPVNVQAAETGDGPVYYCYGDANMDGYVTVQDALSALKCLIGVKTPEGDLEMTLTNIDGQGEVSITDVMEILRIAVGTRQTERYQGKPVDGYYIPQAIEETASQNIGFPGADGFGKSATGGRGGKVYEVTNLNDSGPGSLREAIDAKGARTIVFKVSGTIYLNSTLTVKNGDVTIAGQTAPGDGICLANYGLTISKTNNVIVRYIRSRPGDQAAVPDRNEPDAIWVQASSNVILDHCSTSWAVDETLSVSPKGEGYDKKDVSDNISVQWCMVTESIRMSRRINKRHGMGSLIRGAQGASVTYHHNFYASHSSRMPMIGNYVENELDDGNFNMEFINNLVYNWSGKKSGTCGDADEKGEKLYTTNINYINNVFKSGPLSNDDYAFAEACIGNHMYISGNMMNGQIPEDQKTLVCFEDDVLATSKNPYFNKSGLVIDPEKYFLAEPFAHSQMADIQETAQVEKAVLEGAGASLNRDSVDKAMVAAYEEGKGTTIDSPVESLGWTNEQPGNIYGQQYYEWMQGKYPELASYEGYTDTDHDGMSDQWETFMGLNPENAVDGSGIYGHTGYTNLEVFLQYLVENSGAAIRQ